MGKKMYAYVNPEMLVWARFETPYKTTAEVEAAHPKITADRLAAWEKGEELPSITEAKKLAEIYKLPFAAFYLSEVPAKKIRRYTDRRTPNGQPVGDLSYKLWSEIRRIESNRDSILEFSAGDAAFRPIPNIENDDIGEIAAAIRDHLGLNTPLRTKTEYGHNPFNYYRDIVERSGIIVAQVYGVAIEEMKGLSVYYEPYPVIAVNSKDYDRSKVFSLFHELAHIFRRSSSLCTIDADEYGDSEERICDRIAAAALMPDAAFGKIAGEYASGMIDPISVGRIADRFGVSTFSALRRMFETEIIDRKTFSDLLHVITAEYNANIERIDAERKRKGMNVPYHLRYLTKNGHLLPRTVLIAYASGKITHGEMCKALGVKSRHIGNIEQAVMSE